MMNVSSYQIAYKSCKIQTKIYLNMFSTMIEHLKVNPSLHVQQLRPILTTALPGHIDIDAKYINNFRRRVFIHVARNPKINQISYEEGEMLTRNRRLILSELYELSYAMTASNFDLVYKKIMQ